MSLRKKVIQDEIINIKNQIKTDFFEIVSKTKYSFFAVPLLVFSMTDYLGSLYKGRNSSRSAVAFMRDYFSHSNNAYEDCSGILYFVYRHGLTHQRIPKLTQLKLKGNKISCYITNTTTIRHLRGFRMQNKSAKGLVVCTKSLVEDLLKAVEEYEVDLLANTPLGRTLRKQFSIAYKDSRIFHNENTLLTNPRISYLSINDFDFIREQLKNPIIFKS